MTTHLALLRGINLGSNARLPMKELTAIFRAAGASDIQTYIQSGNVIFTAEDPPALTAAVTSEIARIYGYPGRIVLRSADELSHALRNNPFRNAGAPSEMLHVYFLADKPSPTAVKSLDTNHSPGDSFAIHGREIFLHLPNGMARTKLTNVYFDRELSTVSTARNWKTVTALSALMTA